MRSTRPSFVHFSTLIAVVSEQWLVCFFVAGWDFRRQMDRAAPQQGAS
jgi:hypothetical protein